LTDYSYFDTTKLLALSIAPGLAISVYVFYKDKFEKEPLHLMFKCFLLGALAILPAVFLNKGIQLITVAPLQYVWHALYSFLIVSFSEELSKYLVLRHYAFPKKDFNEPYDGIMYSVMIAMGFATVENIMYVFLQNSFNESFTVGLVRMFTAVPAHATMGILMGYFVGLAKFKPQRSLFLLKGFLAAFVVHGLYDFFLSLQNIPFMTIGAILSLFISINLSLKAMKIHGIFSPFNFNSVKKKIE